MSTTVDNRVVEMQFDNKQFEANVSTTMSTLDKLKQKLNFTGASKGFENINTSAKNVNMNGLANSVETVRMKFSALEVMGVTALTNITNSAVNAGKQLIKSLSVDQLSAGWQKFSDKTTSVATLVAQGNELEKVNEELDRLNWFTDETSYNFTDMVSNIAKFTATGKGLEESVTAMEGIATWAALSGQNAATASRAMYQISQAMGAGIMRLEDYKSIQNASMDTEEFRQKCIDAGIALGTLRDNGNGTYTSLAEGATGASFEISQFANNLTREMWLTSDVMMKVFNDYSSAVGGIYEAAEEKGMLASEIIDEIYTTAETKSISTDEAIKDLGYDFDSFALKAFEAAQKARTFQDAIDSVKDAVSTGWMKTFELIFGDAKDATDLWTGLANTLWDIFASGGETRNTILENALTTTPWKNITDKLKGITSVTDKVEEVADAVGNAADKLQYFQDIVNAVWRGDYNNIDTGRYELLREAGYDERVVQDLVNLGIDYELTIEDIEASHKKFGLTMGETTETIEGTTEVIAALSDEQLEQAGLTEEEIKLYRALEKEAARLDMTVGQLAEEMSNNSGRDKLINSFKNVGSVFLDTAAIIKDAFANIFDIPSIGEMSVMLYSLIDRLESFTENIRLTDSETGEFTETAENLRRTFEGLFAALDIVFTLTGGPLRIAFRVLTAILSAFDMDILGFTANIGDTIVEFRDWIDSILDFEEIFEEIEPVIDDVIQTVKDWFNALRGNEGATEDAGAAAENFKTICEGVYAALESAAWRINGSVNTVLKIIKSVLDIFGTDLATVASKISEYIIKFRDWVKVHTPFIGMGNKIAKILSVIIQGIYDCVVAFMKLEPVQKFLTAVGDAILKFFGKIGDGIEAINFDTFVEKITNVFANIKTWIEGLSESEHLGVDIVTGIIKGIAGATAGVATAVFELAKTIISAFCSLLGINSPSTVFIALGGFIIAGLLIGLNGGFNEVWETLKNFGTTCIEAIRNIDWGSAFTSIKEKFQAINWEKIFSVLLSISALLLGNKLLNVGAMFGKAAEGVGSLLSGIGNFVEAIGKGLNKNLKASAFKQTAQAILMFAVAIGILAGSLYLLTKIEVTSGKLWECVGVIGALAVILVLLAIAMKKLSSASVDIGKGGVKVDGIMSGLLQISLALLAVAATLKVIDGIENPKAALTTLAGIAAGLIVFLALMGGISRYSKNVSQIGGMMIKLAVAMVLMVWACKLVSKLSDEEMAKGILFAAAFAIFVRSITRVAKSAGNNVSKVGGMILKLSIAMMLMVGVCKLAAMLSAEEMLKGAAFAGAFVLFVWGLVKVTKIGKKQQLAKLGGLILSISFSLLLLVGVCKLVGKLSVGEMIKGAIFVAAFMGLVKVLVGILKIGNDQQMAKVAGTIIAIATAIAILAGVSIILGIVPLDVLAKGIAAVGLLSLMMTMMIKGLKGAQNVKGSLIAMTVAIGIMAGAVIALSYIDGSKLASATAAIGSLMLIFGLMTKLSSGAQASAKTAGSLVVMIVIAGLLALIIAALANVPNIENAMTVSASLSMLLLALSASLALICVVSPLATAAHTGLGVMLVVLILVAVVLGIMCNIPNIDKALSVATSLSVLLLAFSAACFIIAGGAAIMSLASAGILPMLGVIIAMGALMAGIAALVTYVPELEGFLSKALPILKLIGQGIGEFLGGIIYGIGSAVLALLPEFGAALSAFMVGVQPFITLAGGVDAGVVAGAGYLTAAILVLTAGSFIAGITQLLGGASFSELGAQLLVFGIGVMAFFNAIKDIDEGAITAATNVANMILALTASEAITALTEKFGGSVDFASMGESLQTFADAVIGFSDTISGKIDTAAVEAATNAGLLLVQLNESLPRSGGWVQDVIGEQDFEKFASACEAFAQCILAINDTLSQEGFVIESDKFQQLVDAGTMFNELNTALPKTGGIAQDLAGEQDLAGFGAACVAFAACMITINTSISQEGFEVKSDKIDQLVTAGTKFNELNTALPKTGGVAQDLAGEQDLAVFGTSCAAFVACMIEVNAAISQEGFNLNLDGIEDLKQAGLKFNELQDALPKTGGWWQNIAGESDIEDFGGKIKSFGESMVDFSTSATGIDTAAVSTALSIAYRLKSLITSLVGLDTSGVDTFTGIGSGGLGADGPANDIAKAIVKFSDEVAGIDTTAVSTATTAASDLKTLIASLVGLDTSGIENFKTEDIGSQIKTYSDKVTGIDTSAISSSITAANSLKNFINSLTSMDTSGISNFKITYIGKTLKAYSANVSGVNFKGVTTSVMAARALKDFINSLANLDASGVGSFKNAINELSTVNIEEVVKAFSGASAKMFSAARDMMEGLLVGMRSKTSVINSTVRKILVSVNEEIGNKLPIFVKAGSAVVFKIASGITKDSKSIASAVAASLTKAANGIRAYYSSFYNAGTYLVSGFANGISANTYRAVAKARAMAVAAKNAAENALGIASPSKVFYKIGAFTGEGFVNALTDYAYKAYKAATEMAVSASSGLTESVSRIADIFGTDLDTQPTIRPVLDLSEVRAGANTLGQMVSGMGASVGVLANVGAINSMMNGNIQNGGNSEVVSEIKKLRKDLGNVGNTSYTVNGVTYDDGSNIATAVKAITRAAIRERRV